MEKISIRILMTILGAFMSTWKEASKDGKLTVDEAIEIVKGIVDKLGLGNMVIIEI